MAISVLQFAQLVGAITHGCCSLEMLTNNAIKRLGKDPIFSKEIVTLSWGRRIKILRDLLHDRTKLSREDVNSLCDEISKIAQDRNVIAHNPIISDAEKGPAILVVRHKI
jgi:chemotaxis protein CheY-P-specific phosphatase CheC